MISKLPDYYYDGQKIEINCSDKVLKFQVHLTPKLIVLTIFTCGKNISLRCELNPVAPVIFTESIIPGSKTNEFGKCKIREMLENYIQY